MDSYQMYLQRVETYQPSKWCAVPIEASPLVCSRFGWKNHDFNILKCEECGAIYAFTERIKVEEDHRTDDQYYEDLLQKKHKENCLWRFQSCPLSFLKLPLKRAQEMRTEFLSRFDKFDILWDLPVVQNLAHSAKDDLKLLCEFLHKRLKSKYEEVLMLPAHEEMKRRVKAQTTLALLGWKLHWNSSFIFQKEDNEKFPNEYSTGMENEPSKTKICFGHQAYLNCSLCNAKVGLWTVKTESEITPQTFQKIIRSKKVTHKDLPTVGTKRQRDYECTGEQKEAKDPFLNKKPAFGLKQFAKVTSLPEEKLSSRKSPKQINQNEISESDFSSYRPVSSNVIFNPSEQHRYFCPYKTDWSMLLDLIIHGNESFKFTL